MVLPAAPGALDRVCRPTRHLPLGNILGPANGEQGTPLTRKSGYLDEGRGRPRAARASGPGGRSEAPPTPQQRAPGVAVDGVGGAVSILLPCCLGVPVLLRKGGWGGPGEREGHLVPEGVTGMGVCQAKFCFILAPKAGGWEGLPFPFSLPSGGGGLEGSPPPLPESSCPGALSKMAPGLRGRRKAGRVLRSSLRGGGGCPQPGVGLCLPQE